MADVELTERQRLLLEVVASGEGRYDIYKIDFRFIDRHGSLRDKTLPVELSDLEALSLLTVEELVPGRGLWAITEAGTKELRASHAASTASGG